MADDLETWGEVEAVLCRGTDAMVIRACLDAIGELHVKIHKLTEAGNKLARWADTGDPEGKEDWLRWQEARDG